MDREEQERKRPPEVVPEPGWIPLEPPRLEGGHRSFVSSDAEGDRLRVRYFHIDGEERLVGRAWFGPGAQGPPGHAHGGSIAAVLDEAMGAAAWTAGHLVVAVRLDTRFLRMLPLDTDTRLEASVERVEGRKVWLRGVLTDDAGEPFAEAEGLFVKLDPERFGPLIEKAAAAFGLDAQELLRRQK
jgi:acyl-coenzyme A thioesterase PaaI-like protein